MIKHEAMDITALTRWRDNSYEVLQYGLVVGTQKGFLNSDKTNTTSRILILFPQLNAFF